MFKKHTIQQTTKYALHKRQENESDKYPTVIISSQSLILPNKDTIALTICTNTKDIKTQLQHVEQYLKAVCESQNLSHEESDLHIGFIMALPEKDATETRIHRNPHKAKYIGRYIKAVRRSKNLSLEELAEKTHIDIGLLIALEEGFIATQDIKIMWIEHICRALELHQEVREVLCKLLIELPNDKDPN